MNRSPESLAERIDDSFGAGPDVPSSLDDLLTRGRRARHRRQVRLVGLVAAAALVVGSGAVLITDDGPARVGRPEVASSPSADTSTDPTSVPSTSAAPSATERNRLRRLADRAVTFGDDGDLSLPPGASVVRFIDNPYGAVAPAWSAGVAVEYHGHEFWYAMNGLGDGSSGGATQYVTTDDSLAAFEQFVAQQDPDGATTSSVGPDVWPDVVQLDAVRMRAQSPRLAARPGFTIIDQRSAVDAGSAWASPDDQTAAALVRDDDGTRYFVLARRSTGKPAQYVVVPRAGHGADLAAFVDLARQRYAGAR